MACLKSDEYSVNQFLKFDKVCAGSGHLVRARQLGIGRRLDFAPKLWQMFSSGAFSCGMARFCSQCPLIFGRKGEGGGCRRTNRPRLGRQRALQQGKMGGGMGGTKEKYLFLYNLFWCFPDGNTIFKVRESLSYRAIFGGCWLFHVCGTKINQLSQSYEGPMSDSLSRRECVGLRSEKGGGRTILDMAFLSKCGQLSSMSIFIQTKRGNEKLLKI